MFLVTNNGAVDPAASSNAPVAATTLAWTIYDISDPSKLAAPAQVATGDLTDNPATVAYVSSPSWNANFPTVTGHYVALWTPGPTEPLGKHRIVWTWTVPSTRNDQMNPQNVTQVAGSWSEDFDVTSFPVLRPQQGYCLIDDLRDEGVTPNDASDDRVQRLIGMQSRYVERITGRTFSPRYEMRRFDGQGGRILTFMEPVIAVDGVHIATSPLFPSDLQIDPDFYRVYNRHLTQGLTQPDDRDNPRIELFHSSEDLAGTRPFTFSRLIWPRGQQNVIITALWGFTDYDGSPAGGTPDLIRHVTKLLVMRELPKMCADRDAREDAQKRYRLLGEGTRDQHYNLEPNRLFGAFTGDSEIDTILAMFMRPPALGAT